MGEFERRRQVSVGIILATTGLVVLQGCQGSAPSDYLQIAGDSCQAERAQLKSVEDHFNQSLIEGSAIGAATGAAIGGVAGALISGDWKGAAIGAGSGAVAGGVSGYFNARQKGTTDRNALVNSIYNDITQERVQVDEATAAFVAIRNCRLREGVAARADAKAKLISVDEANARINRTRELYEQDIAVAEAVGAQMLRRQDELVNVPPDIANAVPTEPIRSPPSSTAKRTPESKPAAKPAKTPLQRGAPQTARNAADELAVSNQKATGVVNRMTADLATDENLQMIRGSG